MCVKCYSRFVPTPDKYIYEAQKESSFIELSKAVEYLSSLSKEGLNDKETSLINECACLLMDIRQIYFYHSIKNRIRACLHNSVKEVMENLYTTVK